LSVAGPPFCVDPMSMLTFITSPLLRRGSTLRPGYRVSSYTRKPPHLKTARGERRREMEPGSTGSSNLNIV
jgi:hypothetical protein